MSRYFLEVSYKGTGYAGFQVQRNAVTVQSEVEKALEVYFRKKLTLTGASRTDTGVHALQNFFHADIDEPVPPAALYNLNAILPADIAIRGIAAVQDGAHCRFDARARQYGYTIYRSKDPFIRDLAYYFPFRVSRELLEEAAEVVKEYRDFRSFAKRNTQVKTYDCTIFQSEWESSEGCMKYTVKANRFLRGMVRGLVGTMLQVGRKKISVAGFREIIEGGNSSKVDFSVPGHGLCLEKVEYAEGYFG